MIQNFSYILMMVGVSFLLVSAAYISSYMLNVEPYVGFYQGFLWLFYLFVFMGFIMLINSIFQSMMKLRTARPKY